MDGETLPPPPVELDGETVPTLLPPATELDGATQPAAAAEIEGETQPLPLPASVSKVLDDDNLLPEIIIRVGFPTTLVRASAVCRRWLGLASDRAFLRRFRELHPPRLLGFYLAQWKYRVAAARFFPVLPHPPPPELAAVVRRGRFSLDCYEGERTDMMGCWNGRVVTSVHLNNLYNHDESRNELMFVVHSPLRSERGMSVLPALHVPIEEQNFSTYRQLFCKEEAGVESYLYVSMVESEAKSMVQVLMLRNGDDA